MLARKQLPALVGAGLLMCLGLSHGCDVLNPQLVAGTGGSPIPAAANINGYVLLVVNNLTDGGVALDHSLDIRQPGSSQVLTNEGVLNMPFTGFAAVSFPCDTREVRLNTLTYSATDVVVDPNDPNAGAGDGTEIELPTTVITTPLLKCGSVIFVTVSGAGQTVVADVQVLN